MGFFKQLTRFTSVACFAAGFIAFGTEDGTFVFNGREWKVVEMECVCRDE